MFSDPLERYRSPKPREVTRYERAVRNGLVPVVPTMPPELAGAKTATTATLNLAYGFIACSLGLVAVSQLARWVGFVVVSPLFFLLLVAFYYAVFMRPRTTLDFYLGETRRGYTTIKGGKLQTEVKSKESALKHVSLPWGFSGVWQLGNDGHVVSPPDRSVDPPGYYPSPHVQDQFELWTGLVWTGNYRTQAELPLAIETD